MHCVAECPHKFSDDVGCAVGASSGAGAGVGTAAEGVGDGVALLGQGMLAKLPEPQKRQQSNPRALQPSPPERHPSSKYASVA
mmetsp:Transcript_114644/g.311335  ORF Transcript_114644/g.311335 Transcript_114644/m.311335 type:complete len:83 (+) Transcript_114644:195-443(+)